jgi:hypothetical protein
MDSASTVRSNFKRVAQQGLPNVSLVHERNGGITTKYASFFLQQPCLFKWAGLATFASRAVGEALLPYEFGLVTAETFRPKRKSPGLPTPQALLEELELLRITNNKVYDDIAWAHLAYCSGGLKLVEFALSDLLQTHRLMAQGFQHIDQGRSLLDKSAKERAEGLKLIWQGNEMLLRHEQTTIVQPEFDRFGPSFDLLLSYATTLAFDKHMFNWVARYRTQFAWFMYLHGWLLLFQTRSLPLLKRLDHRLYWVVNSPLKLWQSLNKSEDEVMQLVKTIAPNAGAVSVAAP